MTLWAHQYVSILDKMNLKGTSGNCARLNASGLQQEQINLEKADCSDYKTGFICQYEGKTKKSNQNITKKNKKSVKE